MINKIDINDDVIIVNNKVYAKNIVKINNVKLYGLYYLYLDITFVSQCIFSSDYIYQKLELNNMNLIKMYSSKERYIDINITSIINHIEFKFIHNSYINPCFIHNNINNIQLSKHYNQTHYEYFKKYYDLDNSFLEPCLYVDENFVPNKTMLPQQCYLKINNVINYENESNMFENTLITTSIQNNYLLLQQFIGNIVTNNKSKISFHTNNTKELIRHSLHIKYSPYAIIRLNIKNENIHAYHITNDNYIKLVVNNNYIFIKPTKFSYIYFYELEYIPDNKIFYFDKYSQVKDFVHVEKMFKSIPDCTIFKKKTENKINALCIISKLTQELMSYDINLLNVTINNTHYIIENIYNYRFLLIDDNIADLEMPIFKLLKSKYPRFPILQCNNNTSYCQPFLHNPINRKYENTCIISQCKFNEQINTMVKNLDANNIKYKIYDKDYILSNDNKYICDGQLTYKQIVNEYKTNKYAINLLNENEINACGCISNDNNVSGYELHINAIKNHTYKHLINSLTKNFLKPLPTNVNKDDILILYLMNDVKSSINKCNEFIHQYNYVKIEITNNKSNKLPKCKYLFIMYDKLEYKNTYIENTLLAYKFTDCKVVGKACYYLNDQIINQQYENTFTNRLHPFTLCINDNNYRLNGNVYDYTISYLRKMPNSVCYSYYKYEFIDTDCVNHLYSLYENISVPKCKTYVIMCNWKRTENFRHVLHRFKQQTKNDYHICIWNNNHNDYNKLINIVRASQLKNVTIFNSLINIGGYGRFICANKLNVDDNTNIIFLDDDQEFDKHFISKFVTNIKENISLHWYGRKFIKNRPYCYVNEQNIIINPNECIKEIDYGQEYDYGGTGGMCINVVPFKSDILFMKFPIIYLYCEDMWSSYILKKYFAYKLIKFDINIVIKRDDNDQCSGLWQTKAEFLEYLRYNNYDV